MIAAFSLSATSGGSRDFLALETRAAGKLKEAGFEPEYVSIRRAEDLGEPQQDSVDLVVLASAWLGKARLIDNLVLKI